ncbi:DUF317 domain-containing protein [Kitasatospora sp. NPDC058032]|uniref:DUF317 domain-containing protein n=1 Tax=Kitasatospora sp. NPDC058032 TaxID=3346307 RepID=UPI0036DC25BF
MSDREPSPVHDMTMTVFPGYLAGPGPDALADFLDGRPQWTVRRPDADSTVALHEDATARIVLDNSPFAARRWTISSYHRPDGPVDWTAVLCPQAPAEVALAVARRLDHALAQPTEEERGFKLWGDWDETPDADELIRAEADRAGWTSTGCTISTARHASSDGTAGLEIRGYHERPATTDADLTYTLWAGPAGRQDPSWSAQFTRFAPPNILLAALHTLTRPAPYPRRASQIPMAHRAHLHTHPHARPRPVPTPTVR